MNIRVAAALLGALTLGACALVDEGLTDGYRIEPVSPTVQARRDTEVVVRFVRLPGNAPVTGAVFSDHRFEMWMSGFKLATSLMVDGRSPPPVISQEEGGGVYRLHVQLPMAGNWQAIVTAQVPGEARPVRERFTITAR